MDFEGEIGADNYMDSKAGGLEVGRRRIGEEGFGNSCLEIDNAGGIIGETSCRGESSPVGQGSGIADIAASGSVEAGKNDIEYVDPMPSDPPLAAALNVDLGSQLVEVTINPESHDNLGIQKKKKYARRKPKQTVPSIPEDMIVEPSIGLTGSTSSLKIVQGYKL
ncbi:purple acid phosphatase 13 [Striga asiatica]|uniref:Purple acid phosphatase 13 n=1 Tax=Striga asiatica TaxID=4170 RepID=A0A5A7PXR7_STRAF|nr:purple acid phosphatase 13 [Striga asiatica]